MNDEWDSVSPYLRRPLRTLREAVGEDGMDDELGRLAALAIAEANADGGKETRRFARAVDRLMALRPGLCETRAVQVVNRAWFRQRDPA